MKCITASVAIVLSLATGFAVGSIVQRQKGATLTISPITKDAHMSCNGDSFDVTGMNFDARGLGLPVTVVFDNGACK